MYAQSGGDATDGARMAAHIAACPACTKLLDDVRKNLLLAADVRRVLSDSASVGTTPLGLVGRLIDGYLIERILGSGASSTVYQARNQGTGELVALKVLSSLASGEEHVRRFEHEARVLGRLHHPAIARMLGSRTITDDAGVRPYIAMELVDGTTITQHAARQSLSIDARLGLLAEACEAVNYAHTQGVIHRDIKPANVLVMRAGSIKVVDFGFARITGGQATMSTMHTAQGRIVGTVAYMSPEHVGGTVDARSDVYSLGALGYELLTGRPVHAISHLPLEAALREITQSEPTLPSRVDPALSGDIEIVLLRALEKRPQDRYTDAGEFAADLRSVLAGVPIGARRSSGVARVRKFARNHRPLVAGAVAVLGALVLGLAGTTYGLVSAVHRSRVAEERRQNAERLASLLKQMLREAHPHEAKGRAYTVRQMLDDFSRRFTGGLEDQPLVEASLRSTMGTGYRVLGEYALARPQLERALAIQRKSVPPSVSGIGEALCDLAWLEHDDGAYAKAIDLFREAAQAAGADAWINARAAHGWSDCLRHAGDLVAARERGSEALRAAELTRGAVVGTGTGRNADTEIAEAHINLSRIERDAGDYAAAQTELDAAMKLLHEIIGADDPRLADALNDEGWLAFLNRDFARAEATVREGMAVAVRTLGPSHPDVANSKYELGLILSGKGDAAGAETLLRDSLAIYIAAHGEQHPSTFTAQEALARVLRTEEKYSEARDLLDRVLSGRRVFFGERNVEVAYALTALAEIQGDLKDTAAAEASTSLALDLYRETFRGPHPFIASGEGMLARFAMDRSDLARAEALYRQAVATSEAAIGPGHADTLRAIGGLAACLEARVEWVAALAQYDRILERRGPTTSVVRAALTSQGRGRCLLALGRHSEALDSLRTALRELEAASSATAARYVGLAREDLARAQEAVGDNAGASETRKAIPTAK